MAVQGFRINKKISKEQGKFIYAGQFNNKGNSKC